MATSASTIQVPKDGTADGELLRVEHLKMLPNSLLVVTLASNFGTFMLYMLTNAVAIVAFREHHTFSGIKHFVIPISTSFTIGNYNEPQTPLSASRADLNFNVGPALYHFLGSDFSAVTSSVSRNQKCRFVPTISLQT